MPNPTDRSSRDCAAGTNENPATRAGSCCTSYCLVQLAAASEAETSEGEAE